MPDTRPFDRPALREWVAHGYRCALVAAPLYGAVNGYVKASLTTEQADQVEVHGGITMHGAEWVGFDTLHSGDVWPDAPSHWSGTPWDKHWDEDKVAEETERFAAEIKRVVEQ